MRETHIEGSFATHARRLALTTFCVVANRIFDADVDEPTAEPAA